MMISFNTSVVNNLWRYIFSGSPSMWGCHLFAKMADLGWPGRWHTGPRHGPFQLCNIPAPCTCQAHIDCYTVSLHSPNSRQCLLLVLCKETVKESLRPLFTTSPKWLQWLGRKQVPGPLVKSRSLPWIIHDLCVLRAKLLAALILYELLKLKIYLAKYCDTFYSKLMCPWDITWSSFSIMTPTLKISEADQLPFCHWRCQL